jgi:alpha-galactosidase
MIDCQVWLQDNILTLETSRIRRRYRWNGGKLIGLRIEDVVRGHGWNLEGREPDLDWASDPASRPAGQLSVREVAATSVTPAHVRAEVLVSTEALAVKRVFRLYPGCPAIACDTYLKGDSAALNPHVGLERLSLPGVHWRAIAVEFRDVTDRNNTLVYTRALLPFRVSTEDDAVPSLVGNLLFLDEALRDRGLFILKEAPGPAAQLAYPGYDFAVQIGEVRAVGLGLAPEDLRMDAWTRAYSVVVGVTGDGEWGRLEALRTYQGQLRLHQPDRDEMVLMNTWGDRGQDTRINEPFALAELEAGSRLGITHLQLDDGWQAGRSSNSAFAGGSLDGIWDTRDYWAPHPDRFPRGLAPIVARGHELGIEVCLWFNPSKDDSYAHWEDDAATLIGLHHEYGIRTFKIDGVQVPDKRAETNLRCMFDAVLAATGDQAVLNLDVTAGRRYGYHTFNEYGNVFLENRYTDWSNYYPHWTLRNLWMLARYVPAQNLQIEFLNLWRNADKYSATDPLAPSNVPFDYAFAVTMMAQPLAWFEATGLPEEAFAIADLVRTYREHQIAIHAGHILPIGEEPSGTGWTGFQSVRGQAGYLLVLREYNERETAILRLYELAGHTVAFRHVAGSGKDFEAQLGEDGRAILSLPEPHTFGLYAYIIRE